MLSSENRWVSSLREFRSSRVIAFCGVMCALAVILGAASINVGPYIKVGLSGLPNQVVDYLFGPAAGAIFSGALEVIKFTVRPDGIYFPGFTLSSILAGLIYGGILYRRPLTLLRVFVAHLCVKTFINIGCNTLWLIILYRKAVAVILPARVMTNLVRLPVDVVVTFIILRTVERVILPIFRNSPDR